MCLGETRKKELCVAQTCLPPLCGHVVNALSLGFFVSVASQSSLVGRGQVTGVRIPFVATDLVHDLPIKPW